MVARARQLAAIAAIAALSGCAGSAAGNAPASGPEGASRSGRGVTIAGEQLWGHGADLITAVKSRVAGMQVQRTAHCPSITMRGQKTILGPSDPHIYVDGTQAANTCILDMLSPTDVERVEVYPMGITRRPGYAAHPYGLILVFSRSSET